MNLKQIQTRVAELTAELLTVSNDLAFLLEGEVSRKQAEHSVFDWRDLRVGDLVHVQSQFRAHGGAQIQPGIYTVGIVEDYAYNADLPFSIYNEETSANWVYHESPEEARTNNYRQRGNSGTNAFGLIRKVY